MQKKSSRRACENLKKNTFQNALRPISIAGKQGYAFTNLQSELISRLVAKNIKINYKIKQANRQTVIGNAISLLKEGGAYHIYRFDIKSFYENIDRKLIFNKLMVDAKCSWQTLTLLSELFDVLSFLGIDGLPRGLGISSALSELALHSFDSKIKHMPEVFYYGRFVDDILIITSGHTSRKNFEDELNAVLFDGLEFHEGNKRTYIAVPKSKDDATSEVFNSFEFLGYEFKVFNRNNSINQSKYKQRKVLIDISSSKVDKVKARLISSFCSYISGAQGYTEYQLLKYRIKALAGNYHITDPISGINIKTGIYYNYIHKNNNHQCALKALDSFLHGMLFSTSHPLSFRITRCLTLSQRRELAGYSFSSGFKKARFHSFTYQILKSVKECWI
ncbi:antiviral reverse transcriptase Drt3a [Pseudomonas syringae]|uniref:antiviral reverse transcriptase Drt3a n=1 Tax=Pseudomonas syringae TaxID=317 RepID=UPI000BFFF8F7|nr:antiviral reverse transcriptase Drt3a [Pseudomonas syringae]